MIGDKITLTVEATHIAGKYTGIEMGLNFTIGAADFFHPDDEEHFIENSIGSVAGVLGGQGGVQLSVKNEHGDVYQITAPDLFLAFLKALNIDLDEYYAAHPPKKLLEVTDDLSSDTQS